jgi:hypothetical protein
VDSEEDESSVAEIRRMTRMYKELKETHKNNSMRILQKKKIKETETTK